MGLKRSKMLDGITAVTKECGQVKLDSSCGKYYTLMYDERRNAVMVESLEENGSYGFTDLDDLHYFVVRRIYESLKVDFELD